MTTIGNAFLVQFPEEHNQVVNHLQLAPHGPPPPARPPGLDPLDLDGAAALCCFLALGGLGVFLAGRGRDEHESNCPALGDGDAIFQVLPTAHGARGDGEGHPAVLRREQVVLGEAQERDRPRAYSSQRGPSRGGEGLETLLTFRGNRGSKCVCG